MTTPFDLHKITRANILKTVEALTLDQINKIPLGFTGNIAWHLGHIAASQQGLIYRLSGNESNLETAFTDKYKKGTTPQAPITQAELDFIKAELISQPDRLANDFDRGIFTNYNAYTTSYGNTIHSIEEAIVFVNVHEALHLGYIMALKRVVVSA